MFFHGANRHALNVEVANGLKITQELIKADRAGGGYVGNYYDDPSVEGDEDTGSPKISCVVSHTTRLGYEDIVGVGINTGDPSVSAVKSQSLGQVKSGL